MYKITIPSNERYTGVAVGVSFVNGEGKTEDNWKASWFEENGYDVEDEKEERKEADLNSLKVEQLKELAKEKGVEINSTMKKEDLIQALSGK